MAKELKVINLIGTKTYIFNTDHIVHFSVQVI